MAIAETRRGFWSTIGAWETTGEHAHGGALRRVHRLRLLLAGLRFSLGFIFLWAFFDKLIGLGFSTAPGKAWINGVSPAAGFLNVGSTGAFGGAFKTLAGNPAVDLLFMGGLFLVGIALVLGIGLRIAGYGGATLMGLMWLSLVPMRSNPLVDDHVVYAIVLLALPYLHAGHTLGLGRWWGMQPWVRRHSILE